MKETIIRGTNMVMEKSHTRTGISSILENGIGILTMGKARCGGTPVMKHWKPMMILMLRLTLAGGLTISIMVTEPITGLTRNRLLRVYILKVT